MQVAKEVGFLDLPLYLYPLKPLPPLSLIPLALGLLDWTTHPSLQDRIPFCENIYI